MQIGKSNIYTYDKSSVKTYIAVAEQKLAKGDLEGALSFYLECEKKEKFPIIIFKKIANLYTDLQMYDKSIIYWYKLLNASPKRYKYECYNALGANYYFLREEELATHYFNLQISKLPDKEYPFDDVMLDFYNELLSNEPKTIRLVDNQGEFDEKKITRAQTLFEKHPEEAYFLLHTIKKTSSRYADAQLLLGAFYMIDGNYFQAIGCYEKISTAGKNTEFALNNLLGAYFCAGDTQGVNQTLIRLKKCGSADFTQLAKFFHILNDKNGSEKCYKYSQLLSQIFSGANTYFYRAVSAYNYEKYDEAEYFFASYYKITKDYFVKYCLEATRAKIDGKRGYPKTLRYERSLELTKVSQLEKQLEKYLSKSKKYIVTHQEQIFEFAEWCFATTSEELQAIAGDFLCTIGSERAKNFIKQVLINPTYTDSLKTLLITALVLMGNEGKTGVVFNNLYVEVPFESVYFTHDKTDVFLNAYAFAFGRVAAFDEKILHKLKKSAEEIYFTLLTNGNISEISDVMALCAVIIIYAGVDKELGVENIMVYNGASNEEIERVITLIENK